MSRSSLETVLVNSTNVPSNLILSPQWVFAEIQNDEEKEGIQETTAQVNTSEDYETITVFTEHHIGAHTFHLPSGYEFVKFLGKGAHGIVVQARKVSAGRDVAIKEIKLCLKSSNLYGNNSYEDDKKFYQWKSVYRELSLLRQLNEKGGHPNVIMLEDAFSISMPDEYKVMLVTNLMETSLDALMKSRSLTNDEKRQYIYQILCGLHYLHSNNIIHRDLKAANILVNGDKLCIADLGQARVNEISRDPLSLTIVDTTSHKIMTDHGVGTFIYRAPELHFKCSDYTYPVDLWSAGCIFGEMFIEPKKTLFTVLIEEDDNPFILIPKVFKLIGTPTSPEDIEWAPGAFAPYIRNLCSQQPSKPTWNTLSITDHTTLDLQKKLLEFNPYKRITAKEALQHTYFYNMLSSNPLEVPLYSSASFTPTLNTNQFTTREQIRAAIDNEINLISRW